MPRSVTEVMAALRKVQLFSVLTDEQMEFIARRAVARSYDAGELIFSEGEPCAGMFVVESGSLRIFKSSASGREQVLSIEGPGTSVAELPVFDGGNYPASASTLVQSVLVFVSRKDFQALVMAHPEVALRILKVVGARLRRLVGIIEELSFTTVRQRLAAHLLRLADAHGTKTPKGIEVAVQGSHQEIAAHIGTVRELVSRNLSRFQAEGAIRMEGKSILITNREALQSEVEAEA